jgi:tRNA pseudouridine38-40 synthase
MKTYKIVVAYDGTGYHGWQIQVGQHPTVCAVLQNTFKIVFGKEITIAGASRTDAGVHALGQTAAFSTDLRIEPKEMLEAWQRKLPESIVIRSLERVKAGWNPRARVKQKIYQYHFFTERPLPFIARYGWYYWRPLDLKKLKKALKMFKGTHDFRSFCTGDDFENTVRTIDAITLEYVAHYKAYRITVKGAGFLRYMIRRIVGACLTVASHDKLTVDYLKTVLAQKNPEQTLLTAPAQGLLLYKIHYK